MTLEEGMKGSVIIPKNKALSGLRGWVATSGRTGRSKRCEGRNSIIGTHARESTLGVKIE